MKLLLPHSALRNRVVLAGLIANLLFSPTPSQATEGCPEFPCRDSGGNFSKDNCTKKADWIAVGVITEVTDAIEGLPLNKNFAEFTFKVSYWEKAGKTKPEKIKFRVGWCANDLELPTDRSGMFRFYGSAQPNPEREDSGLYLYFEKLPLAGDAAKR